MGSSGAGGRSDCPATYLVSIGLANPNWVRREDHERLTADDFIVWDVVLVFAAGSRWESTLPPPSFYGGPVVHELDAIRAALGDDRPMVPLERGAGR